MCRYNVRMESYLTEKNFYQEKLYDVQRAHAVLRGARHGFFVTRRFNARGVKKFFDLLAAIAAEKIKALQILQHIIVLEAARHERMRVVISSGLARPFFSPKITTHKRMIFAITRAAPVWP